ncbi:LrgB family protein [Amedibacillus sp. YH-ame10]
MESTTLYGEENKMMDAWLQSPMFGILLSLVAFEIGLYIQKKTKLVILNPLLVAIILIIICLLCTGIDLKTYQIGGDMINLFLGPATVVLAVPLYQHLHSLKNYFFPIMIGIVAGVISGLLSTALCAYLFHFDASIAASLMPKSITTPIGIELSAELGGIPAITVLTILITGIIGAVMSDFVFRLFRIKYPIARGIALGASAHAIGTTKAISMGKVEGAMSSLAIGVTGILTVLLAPTFWALIQQIFN